MRAGEMPMEAAAACSEVVLKGAGGRLGLLGLEAQGDHVHHVTRGKRRQDLVLALAEGVDAPEALPHDHGARGGEGLTGDVQRELGGLAHGGL